MSPFDILRKQRLIHELKLRLSRVDQARFDEVLRLERQEALDQRFNAEKVVSINRRRSERT